MKRFQIGLTVIIAVLAMSFTIAKHTDTFDSKRPFAINDCFKAGGTNGLKVKRANCLGSVITITPTSSCSVPLPGDHIFSLDTANSIPASEIPVICAGVNIFCCLQVAEDAAPCIGQPTFDIGAGAKHYKISAVYCQEI